MRPPGFAMYLLHFHRIRCRCSFRQNSGYNERRRRKVRCRQQRFQLLPSQSGWRLQLRFPCTTDRKSKGGFLCFSISSCLQCEQDQADQRSDSANCNHQKKELHFRKPLTVDLTVLGEIVACCQIRIQCNKDLLIIICNLIVQQIASRCFHGRAVFSCCIRTDFVGTAGPVNSKGERIGRFLRNGCCVTIFQESTFV